MTLVLFYESIVTCKPSHAILKHEIRIYTVCTVHYAVKASLDSIKFSKSHVGFEIAIQCIANW